MDKVSSSSEICDCGATDIITAKFFRKIVRDKLIAKGIDERPLDATLRRLLTQHPNLARDLFQFPPRSQDTDPDRPYWQPGYETGSPRQTDIVGVLSTRKGGRVDALIEVKTFNSDLKSVKSGELTDGVSMYDIHTLDIVANDEANAAARRERRMFLVVPEDRALAAETQEQDFGIGNPNSQGEPIYDQLRKGVATRTAHSTADDWEIVTFEQIAVRLKNHVERDITGGLNDEWWDLAISLMRVGGVEGARPIKRPFI